METPSFRYVAQFLPPDLVAELRLIALITGSPGYRPHVTATTLHCTPPWGIPAQQRARAMVQREVEDKFNLSHETFVETTVLINWFPGAFIDRHVDNGKDYLSDREYSAVVWLNDDFEGGSFFAEPEQVSHEFAPRVGDAVFFRADIHHGVQKVTKGVRQSLLMWFTTNTEACEDHKLNRISVESLTPVQRLFGIGPQASFENEELLDALRLFGGSSRESIAEVLWEKWMAGSFEDFRGYREKDYDALMDGLRKTSFL